MKTVLKMAEKYGWADDFVTLVSGDRAQSLPLRVNIRREAATSD